MDNDPRTVAARLGFDPTLVRRLEARGYLQRLELTDAEVRERLYRAYLARLRGAPTRARGVTAHSDARDGASGR